MKQSNELNNLLALIFQDGRIKIENGQLLIPSEIANRFGDQIRRFKPEILLAFGYCPICARELAVKAELIKLPNRKRYRRHSWCPDQVGHYDKWEF